MQKLKTELLMLRIRTQISHFFRAPVDSRLLLAPEGTTLSFKIK